MKAIVIAALVSGLCGTGALAETAPYRDIGLVGPVTGNPERDTVAFVPAESAEALDAGCRGGLRFTSETVMVGAPTGDPEKDSVGFRVIGGEDDCSKAMADRSTRP